MSEINKYNGIYQELAESLGDEVIKKIYDLYKGQQVTFPMRLYSKEYIVKYILENYNGNNGKELIRKFGYSERWLRNVINETNTK